MATQQVRLSRAVIVDFAIRVADSQGITNVTLANIAAEAGCRAPSLYNHIDGLDDVLDELCLATTADFANSLRDSVVAKVGADAVRSYAHAWRSYVLEHPGRYQATLRAMPHRHDEHHVAARGVTIPAGSILSTLGIPDKKLDDAGRALRSALHGFSQLELSGNIGPDPAKSFEAVIDMVITGLGSPNKSD